MLPDVPRRVGPVTGLGISRVDFDFKIFASSNVLVIRTSKAGVDKTLKEGEDYTVTWDEDQTANIGGYITLDEFLADGDRSRFSLMSHTPRSLIYTRKVISIRMTSM